MIIIGILLAGCWDERLYKEHSVVSLVGVEGKIGEVKAYYSYPEAVSNSSNLVIIESEGKTPREARADADTKVEQKLDVSMMSALLIGVSPAEEGLLNYLDIYYREPSTSISTLLILVEGGVKQYLEASKSWVAEAGEFFTRLIESNEKDSVVTRYTVQTAGAIFYAEGMDIALPYVKMDDDEQRPLIGGLGLFSGDKFTGRIIEKDQSIYLCMLIPKNKGTPQLSFLYNGKPLSITVIRNNHDWTLTSSNSIKLSYHLTIELDEYVDSELRDVEKVKEIEGFLNKEIQKKLTEVVNILQEEKSDPLGLGKSVRVKDFKMFNEKDWHETFANLNLEVEVKTEIVTVGIIQ